MKFIAAIEIPALELAATPYSVWAWFTINRVVDSYRSARLSEQIHLQG